MVPDWTGLDGSAPLTVNTGIQPNHVDIHRDNPTTRPCRNSRAHSP